MTLLNCPECGHDVSSWAQMCLNCGCPVDKFETVTEIKDASCKVGSTITFGGYSWLVLKRDGGDILIITEDSIMPDTQFHKKMAATAWASCTLRKRLNGKFLESFTAADRAKILLVTNENPANPAFGTKGCSDTDDYVFCLSMEEAQSLMTEQQRKATGDRWLRSPGGTRNNTSFIYSDGTICEEGYGAYYYLSVRPAMWIRL